MYTEVLKKQHCTVWTSDITVFACNFKIWSWSWVDLLLYTHCGSVKAEDIGKPLVTPPTTITAEFAVYGKSDIYHKYTGIHILYIQLLYKYFIYVAMAFNYRSLSSSTPSKYLRFHYSSNWYIKKSIRYSNIMYTMYNYCTCSGDPGGRESNERLVHPGHLPLSSRSARAFSHSWNRL